MAGLEYIPIYQIRWGERQQGVVGRIRRGKPARSPMVERLEATGDRLCVERGVDCVRWTGAIVMVRVASGLCFESRWRGSKRRKEDVRRQTELGRTEPAGGAARNEHGHETAPEWHQRERERVTTSLCSSRCCFSSFSVDAPRELGQCFYAIFSFPLCTMIPPPGPLSILPFSCHKHWRLDWPSKP